MNLTTTPILFFLLGINLIFAQDKLNFDYKLNYIFSSENSEEAGDNVDFYFSSNNPEANKLSILFSSRDNNSVETLLLKQGEIYNIYNSDLNNNFKFKYEYYSNPVEKLFDFVTLTKYGDSVKFNDYSCNPYLISSNLDGINDETKTIICIDENNKLDNTSVVFQNQKNSNIKGLVIYVSHLENKNQKLYLNKIENVSTSIQINLEKELAVFKVKQDSIQKLYDSYEETEIYDENSAIDSVAVGYDYFSNYNLPKFCENNDVYSIKFEGENASIIAATYASQLCNYGYSFSDEKFDEYKSFLEKDIKSATKNMKNSKILSKKDADKLYEFLKNDITSMTKGAKLPPPPMIEAMAVPSTAPAVYPWEYTSSDFMPYVSNNKIAQPEIASLAITNYESDSPTWNVLPKYCLNLEQQIPNFSNQELKLHAKNYAGQICDMYLAEFLPDVVYYKGTFDEIRAEQLYLYQIRENLSQKDKKLLDEFLNNLD